LPSSILSTDKPGILRAAYMYYTVANSVPLTELVLNALIMAKTLGYDVFNALDIQDNEEVFK